MKPRRKALPAFQGVGVVPLMKSEYLKRDIIHQHMVSHYRRLYNAKSDIDTSSPQYFKPMFKPRPRPPLPRPVLPVKTTLTSGDKDHIEDLAGNRGPWWHERESDRHPIATTEEFMESVMMSIEDRRTAGCRKKAKVQQCRRIQSISISPGSKNHNMSVSTSSLSRSTSKLNDVGYPACSRLREMSIYHPPRRRMQKKEVKENGKPSYVYCSGCLAKINKSGQKEKSQTKPAGKKMDLPLAVSSIVKTQKEDLKYLQFIQGITQDILQNDAYTNEDLNIIFQKHIALNKRELNLARMQQEIMKLKVQLDVPCKDSYWHAAFSFKNDILPKRPNTEMETDIPSVYSSDDNISSKAGTQNVKIQNKSQNHQKISPVKLQNKPQDDQKISPVKLQNKPQDDHKTSPVTSHSKHTIPCGVVKVTAVRKDEKSNKKVDNGSKDRKMNDIKEFRKESEDKKLSKQTEEKTEEANDLHEEEKTEENKVISFLENMGFNSSMAREICDCMSDKDLMNLQIPFDSEDKEWIEKLEDFEAFNFEALNEVHSEPEDSNDSVESYEPPFALVGEGDAELEQKQLSEKASELKKNQKKQKRNKASGDAPNTNPVQTDKGNGVAPVSDNTSETKEPNPISGATVPGVPSPVGSDYSSMKDHDDDDDDDDEDDEEEEEEEGSDDDSDDSYKSSLAGEEADEGRESASEVEEEEDIPEDISDASSSSGISQLAEGIKTISVRNIELKANKPCNGLTLLKSN